MWPAVSGCSGRTEDFVKTSSVVQETADSGDPSSAPKEAKEVLLVVYVCGAVSSPGVYELPEGSRIFQAAEAAGGFLPDAALEAVNLAEAVYDGQQIRIPFAGETGEGEGISGQTGDGRIDLNTATVEELCTLPGIGEAKAAAIIAYRETNGPFRSVEDLMQVEGIKEGVYSKIKDKITIR